MWTGRVLHWLRAVAQVPVQAHSAGSQRHSCTSVRVSIPVDHHLPVGQSQKDQSSRILFEVSNRRRRIGLFRQIIRDRYRVFICKTVPITTPIKISPNKQKGTLYCLDGFL